jgi:hypothetical protein
MGSNWGLKEFGALGYEATVKELDDNLLGMGAVKMLKPSELSRTIRYESLNYLMFLKRKRCGKLKARGCADGRPQREYISKDESSSPTVSIYALMTSCLMDAIEGQKVATCDIPGAFLQADWPADRDCYLKFEGAMVSMICDIDPKYKKNIVYGKMTVNMYMQNSPRQCTERCWVPYYSMRNYVSNLWTGIISLTVMTDVLLTK